MVLHVNIKKNHLKYKKFILKPYLNNMPFTDDIVLLKQDTEDNRLLLFTQWVLSVGECPLITSSLAVSV